MFSFMENTSGGHKVMWGKMFYYGRHYQNIALLRFENSLQKKDIKNV